MRLRAAALLLVGVALAACPRSDLADSGFASSDGGLGCEACRAEQACVLDACFDNSCPQEACAAGQVCSQGACASLACVEARCPSGTACVGGRCYGLWCGNSECSPGQVCDGLACVDARCLGVACPTGSRCEAGRCTTCDPGFVASDAGCAPKRLPGESCVQDIECQLGFCRQGVCCRTSCSGACEACGAGGTCAVTPRGQPGSPSCAPGRCDGVSRTCALACSTSPDCSPGAFCRSGVCFSPQPNGRLCAAAHECDSGFCTEGQCCDRLCADPCEKCSGVPGASDAGTCAKALAGATPRALACGLLACSGSSASCPTQACAAAIDCLAEAYCDGGTCTSDRTIGSACAGDSECTTGFCTDGRCCNARCDGVCRSCNNAVAGVCSEDPAGTLTDGGFCADGIVCATPCSSPCQLCTLDGGVGVCRDRELGFRSRNGVCGATACDGAGACFTSCSPPMSVDGLSCLEKTYCDSGATCAFQLPAGAPCTSDLECDRAQSTCCQPTTFTCGNISCV